MQGNAIRTLGLVFIVALGVFAPVYLYPGTLNARAAVVVPHTPTPQPSASRNPHTAPTPFARLCATFLTGGVRPLAVVYADGNVYTLRIGQRLGARIVARILPGAIYFADGTRLIGSQCFERTPVYGAPTPGAMATAPPTIYGAPSPHPITAKRSTNSKVSTRATTRLKDARKEDPRV